MEKNTVSIAMDGEFIERLARLLGSRPMVTGAHCGEDDGGADGVHRSLGAVALGAHCGDDDEV